MDTITGHIRLDFRSEEPIYVQIVRQVEQLVREGILKPGDQLPTVRQMAIDLRINFSTVARAYHILDEQKLISTQRGRGTYIWAENGLGGHTPEPQLPAAREIDREAQARQMAQAFLEAARQQGFSLEEIQAAFTQELARRKKTGS